MAIDDYNNILPSLNVKQGEMYCHVMHWIQRKEEPIYIFIENSAADKKTWPAKVMYKSMIR